MSTKHDDKPKDPLEYEGPMTRACMRKFKAALYTFMQQEIIPRMKDQSINTNGAQLSAFGGSMEQGQIHLFYTLLANSDLQNEEFMSNSLSGEIFT